MELKVYLPVISITTSGSTMGRTVSRSLSLNSPLLCIRSDLNVPEFIIQISAGTASRIMSVMKLPERHFGWILTIFSEGTYLTSMTSLPSGPLFILDWLRKHAWISSMNQPVLRNEDKDSWRNNHSATTHLSWKYSTLILYFVRNNLLFQSYWQTSLIKYLQILQLSKKHTYRSKVTKDYFTWERYTCKLF